MSSDDPTGGFGDDPSDTPPPSYPPPTPPESGWVPPGEGWGPHGYPSAPPGYGGPPPGYGWPHGYPGWGAPQPPKPGIIPLRPLGLGELLDGGFALIRRYPAATLGLSAAVMFVVEAVQLTATYFIVQGAGPSVSIAPDGTQTISGAAIAVQVLVLLVSLFSTVLLTGMLTAVVGPAVLGKRVTPAEAGQQARARFWRLMGATFAVFAVVAGAALACVAPGLVILALGAATGTHALTVLGAILAVCGGIAGVVLAVSLQNSLGFAPQIVMLEGQRIRASLKRSRSLVKGSWWRVFGISLLAAIIAQVVAGVIGLPFTIVTAIHTFGSFSDTQGVNYTFTDLLLSGIGGLLGATLARPFAAGVRALLYIDQRMRREALDLTLQQAAAAPTS